MNDALGRHTINPPQKGLDPYPGCKPRCLALQLGPRILAEAELKGERPSLSTSFIHSPACRVLEGPVATPLDPFQPHVSQQRALFLSDPPHSQGGQRTVEQSARGLVFLLTLTLRDTGGTFSSVFVAVIPSNVWGTMWCLG